MSQPLVSMQGVGKQFPGRRKGDAGRLAIRSFDGQVQAGEVVSLLGPSGCGKSTLLRIAAGLIEPTTGTVERGFQLETSGANRPVACVFQEPTLLPWSRVWENVWLPLRLAGLSRKASAERVDAAIQRVGLADAARNYPRQLSGGMKMRVSIARALVTQPRLLLLDEPFAALDEISRLRLNDDLLSLRDEYQFGVLFITHSVYESVYLSDRVVVLSAAPASVVGELAIDLPKPRDEATRSLPRYAKLCEEASALLRSGSEAAEGAAHD